MKSIVIKDAKIVNRGKITSGDILIKNGRIERVAPSIQTPDNHEEIIANGNWVIPGIIDDQVHFREPGLTHKANIRSESLAAVAGGVTSFMEMPNTKPNAVTQELLEEKYQIAAKTSAANYSFYMGATNDNVEEVLKTNAKNVCGVKIFMGSSTGNMLVDNYTVLDKLFSKIPMLIATHCEDESTVVRRKKEYFDKIGNQIDASYHPIIRNEEACYLSSKMAVDLANKYKTRLHILHISTEKELSLFSNLPIEDKHITAEICVHHLFFDDRDYKKLGTKVQCNPAIKSLKDKQALRKGLREGFFDVIATDHAPHTSDEKSMPYGQAPSGLPLVQHALNVMLEIDKEENYGIPFIVEKMCHSPARLFGIEDRGYIDEGKFADLVIVDPNHNWTVSKENLHYKCGWSPLEHYEFQSKIVTTIINGQLAFHREKFVNTHLGERLMFS